jgi:hypothetical protein
MSQPAAAAAAAAAVTQQGAGPGPTPGVLPQDVVTAAGDADAAGEGNEQGIGGQAEGGAAGAGDGGVKYMSGRDSDPDSDSDSDSLAEELEHSLESSSGESSEDDDSADESFDISEDPEYKRKQRRHKARERERGRGAMFTLGDRLTEDETRRMLADHAMLVMQGIASHASAFADDIMFSSQHDRANKFYELKQRKLETEAQPDVTGVPGRLRQTGYRARAQNSR